MVDRLPIYVTGTDIPRKGDSTQLLGVPRLPRGGTGEAQAEAVVSALWEWNLEKNVVALCFDTTSSNTGSSTGCCVRLERLLGRNLLYFACRHHVLEVVVGHVFTALHGSSTGPYVLLFRRFKDHWIFVDQEDYADGWSDPDTRKAFEAKKETVERTSVHCR